MFDRLLSAVRVGLRAGFDDWRSFAKAKERYFKEKQFEQGVLAARVVAKVPNGGKLLKAATAPAASPDDADALVEALSELSFDDQASVLMFVGKLRPELITAPKMQKWALSNSNKVATIYR